MSELLKLPLGIENFSQIRTEGYYYADKTELIEQLLNNPSKVNLFTRPRRFGKTLTMSMLVVSLRRELIRACLTDYIYPVGLHYVSSIWADFRLYS